MTLDAWLVTWLGADVGTFAAVMGVILLMGVVQGSVAFAGGLIGIPLLALAGLEMYEAVAVSIFCGIPQNLTGSWQLRKEIPWSRTFRPILVRLLFLPLGALALVALDDSVKWLIDPVVGAVMLGLLGLLVFVKVEHRPELPVGWEILTCVTSGFLVGFCGMGGPPLVVWALAHDWSASKTKGFLFAVYAANLAPQLLLMTFMWGEQLHRSFAFGLIGMPLSSVGMLLGLSLSHWIQKRALRRIAYGVILFTAVMSLLQPFLDQSKAKPDETSIPAVSDAGETPPRDG